MSEKRRGASDVERWNRAVREASTKTDAAPGAKDVLEASEEEIERQLLAAGVDLEAEDAKADATYDAMVTKLGQASRPAARDAEARESADDVGDRGDAAWVAEAEPKNVIPMRRSRAVWLAYAVAAAAATGGAAYVAAHWGPPEEPQHEEPVVVPPPVTSAAPTPPAPPAPEPAKRGADPKGPR